MSRYTDSVWKKSRHLGFSVLETGEELKKRPYGPGQHGQDRKRKPSEYGVQLLEKQKLRNLYGVNERQFRRLFVLAKKEPTVTGLAFFRILESRLDNLVYRMGFARTRAAARQLVNHGHVTVNGKKVDIPSSPVSPSAMSSRATSTSRPSSSTTTASFNPKAKLSLSQPAGAFPLPFAVLHLCLLLTKREENHQTKGGFPKC